MEHIGFPRHRVFQPPECQYRQYTRSEVLEYYQGGNVDIMVVGDSFIRQLFVRLVHLFRGQASPFPLRYNSFYSVRSSAISCLSCSTSNQTCHE